MTPEGMVHALRQLVRVLKPRGTLIDIRPERYSHPRQRRPALPTACWRSHHGDLAAGRLGKVPSNLRRHRAATRALRDVVQRGMLRLESTETFPFRFHFRNLEALEAFINVRWTSTILPARVRRRLSALQRSPRRGEIVVVEPLRLNVLRKP
jgi:hypothetical protein